MADVTLEEVLTALTGFVAAADPDAVVIGRPLLGLENEGVSVDPFRRDDGIVDAWLIYPEEMSLNRGGDGVKVSYDMGLSARARRYEQRWRFTVRCYYQYQTGDATTNSAVTFYQKLLTIQRALAVQIKLGLNNPLLLQHGDLQLRVRPMIGSNDTLVHFAIGQLEVLSYRSMTSQ